MTPNDNYWEDYVMGSGKPMADDPRKLAALATALRSTGALWSANDYYEVTTDADEFAAAILAAMPGWTLVRLSPYIDENEHARQSNAGTHLFDPMCGYCASGEIERLQIALAEATLDLTLTRVSCGAPIALFEVAYGDQYEPCARPKGHTGYCEPALTPQQAGR